MSLFLLFTAVIMTSFFLTRYIIYYAQSTQIIDHPNHRSFHDFPVPRGGGLSFVLSTLLVLPIMYFSGYNLPSGTIVFVALASLIAAIGLLDDYRNLSAGTRIVLYGFISALELYHLGGVPTGYLSGWQIHADWIIQLIGWIYLLWMINLYNFMDGINGLAAFEAICVCMGAAGLYLFTGHAELIYLPVIIAASVIGFVAWNFPTAKIFMGDAGSCYLGLILAGLSIQAAWAMPNLFWSWLILLGVFIVDSSYTLMCRTFQGLKIHQAHRSHAYQNAATLYGQQRVTITVVVINLVWLLPIAIFVGMKSFNPFLGVFLAYTPIFFMAIYFRAGINSP